jgi:hypothetical protein
MRLDRRILDSLNFSIKQAVSPTKEETAEELDEFTNLKEQDVEDMTDAEAADVIIRYNQVVNRALRAKYLSRTRRRAI